MSIEVVGEYGTMRVGQGFLVGQTSINPETASEAALFADDQIDDLFSRWDRSTWGPDGPRSITQIWLRFCTGEYLDRVHGVGNPTSDPNHLAIRLKREAKELASVVIDKGGPKVNGEIQGVKATAADKSNRSIEIRHT